MYLKIELCVILLASFSFSADVFGVWGITLKREIYVSLFGFDLFRFGNVNGTSRLKSYTSVVCGVAGCTVLPFCCAFAEMIEITVEKFPSTRLNYKVGGLFKYKWKSDRIKSIEITTETENIDFTRKLSCWYSEIDRTEILKHLLLFYSSVNILFDMLYLRVINRHIVLLM